MIPRTLIMRTIDPQRSVWLWSLFGIGTCILAGAAVRQIAIQLESPIAAELSNAVLFTPCSLAAIWIGWRTESTYKPFWLGPCLIAMALTICFLARYQIAVGANSIAGPTVSGYCSSQSFWVAMQAAHWLVFLAAGGLVAKVLQWTTRIGIWSNHGDDLQNREPGNREPGALSLAKLLALMTLCAVLIAAYQRWVLAWSPGLTRTYSSPTWFQLFPVGSRPWVAGLLGGLLLPIHWLAIASILNLFGRDRTRNVPLCVGLLGTWCLVAACLQAGCSELYFPNAIEPLEPSQPAETLARWVEYSIGRPYTGISFAGIEKTPFWFYCLRSVLQSCLVNLGILWLWGLGMRVGFYRDRLGDSKSDSSNIPK